MKRVILCSAFALAMAAGSAHAQAITPDEESLTYRLSGEVASNCELVPEGTINYTVDMLNTGNQGFAAVAYSCNSPYTLKIHSKNGGMLHTQSGTLKIDYDVETFGFRFPGTGTGAGAQSFRASQMQGSGNAKLVDSVNTWQNIAAITQGGSQVGNMDLRFTNLATYAVAGNYEDEVTLVLKANF